jgi:hypothetical protein
MVTAVSPFSHGLEDSIRSRKLSWRSGYERSYETDAGEPGDYDAAPPGRLFANCPGSDRDNVYRDRSGERDVQPESTCPINIFSGFW